MNTNSNNDTIPIEYGTPGQKIRSAREKLGLTQTELAKKVELHPVTMSRIELGKCNAMRATTMQKLAEVLALPLDYMLCDDSHLRMETKSEPPTPGPETLRFLREQKYWSQGHLARVANVDTGAISQYERKMKLLSQEQAQAIAKALGSAIESIAPHLSDKEMIAMPTSENDTFSSRFSRLMDITGTTNSVAAHVAGISVSAIVKLRIGKTLEPGSISLLRIAKHFKVSPYYLMCLSDDPKDDTPVAATKSTPKQATAIPFNLPDLRIPVIEETVRNHHTAIEGMNTRIEGMARNLDSLITFLREQAIQEPSAVRLHAHGRRI